MSLVNTVAAGRLIARRAFLAGVMALAVGLAGCAAGTHSAEFAATWTEGLPADPAVRARAELVLHGNGSLDGTDGCNSISGSWSNAGTRITFSGIRHSALPCPSVSFWILGLATADVTGDTMEVMDSTGAKIGTLIRQ